MKKTSALIFSVIFFLLFLLIPTAGAYNLYSNDPDDWNETAFQPFTNTFGDEDGNLIAGTYRGTYLLEGGVVAEYEAILTDMGVTNVEVTDELYTVPYVSNEDDEPIAGTWATFDGFELSTTDPVVPDMSTISWDPLSDTFIDILIVKAGNYASFFSSDFASTYGTWNTAFLPTNGNNPIEMSHVRGSVGTAPVPEPSTIVLMGLGLVGLAGIGRKKFKQ
jgi:hypothetical protein